MGKFGYMFVYGGGVDGTKLDYCLEAILNYNDS